VPAADVFEQALDELFDVTIGEQGGGLGVAMADADADEEGRANGLDRDGAEVHAGGWSGAGSEVFEVGTLKDLAFFRSEGLQDALAHLGAGDDLEVGIELHVAVDARIHDLLAGDDLPGFFDPEGGGAAV